MSNPNPNPEVSFNNIFCPNLQVKWSQQHIQRYAWFARTISPIQPFLRPLLGPQIADQDLMDRRDLRNMSTMIWFLKQCRHTGFYTCMIHIMIVIDCILHNSIQHATYIYIYIYIKPDFEVRYPTVICRSKWVEKVTSPAVSGIREEIWSPKMQLFWAFGESLDDVLMILMSFQRNATLCIHYFPCFAQIPTLVATLL